MVSVVLVLAAATVAMARAKERKTLENDGKGRESTTRGTGQKASHAQTPTHAAHAAQHPHSQQRECAKRRQSSLVYTPTICKNVDARVESSPLLSSTSL